MMIGIVRETHTLLFFIGQRMQEPNTMLSGCVFTYRNLQSSYLAI